MDESIMHLCIDQFLLPWENKDHTIVPLLLLDAYIVYRMVSIVNCIQVLVSKFKTFPVGAQI